MIQSCFALKYIIPLLRTVCGCERLYDVPAREYPPFWSIPYRLAREGLFWPDVCTEGVLPAYKKRTFERTSTCNPHGTPIYLEVLEC